MIGGRKGGRSITDVGVESAGSMNHNVHYVETRKEKKLDYVISCMHRVS